jgi:hypothetical protein
MGVMHFQVPSNLTAEAAEGLRRAYLGGDFDRKPLPTRVELSDDRLHLRRDHDQSGFVCVPWDIAGAGRLIGNTATLMEQPAPYRLLVELARGKVNQVRSQSSEWSFGGLDVHPAISEQIHAATMSFVKALMETNNAEAERQATNVLSLAYGTGESLIALYIEQVFAFRRQRETFEPVFGCRLTEVPPAPFDDDFRLTFNTVGAPLNWRATEPHEAQYFWDSTDRVVDWAVENSIGVVAGPLIDFSKSGTPDWLQTWEGDLPSLASFMCDYIETAVTRYRDRVRRWVISTASNCPTTLGLSEEDLMRLTARLAEAAWGIDSNLEVVIGLAQPWGEYLAASNFEYSPFVFADTLMRAGLPLAGFEMEWHMGCSPRGTYCRDPLEASRLLDMFSILGCPLQLALSYPSSEDRDLQADPQLVVGKSGFWHGLTPLAQAEWAETYTALALAKGNITGAFWEHLCDSVPHRFPNAGLIDSMGNRKPSFDRLRILRETFLTPGRSDLLA